MARVGINEFVKRQTPDSPFSYFDGTWEELAALVDAHFDSAVAGYRDGVVLVPVPAERFYAGVARVTDRTELRAELFCRAVGEAPFVQVLAVGEQKAPALTVEVVCYRRDVLEEEMTRVSGAEWDVISINATDGIDGQQPLTPIAMARNLLGLPGGTKATYTAEEFARSIVYWSTRAMIAGS